LNEHRTSPLPDEWWPVSVFSTFTDKDTTTVLDWDGEWGLRYRCNETGKEESLDLRTTAAVKLPWRVDWPMRWALEGVDFEPAGKDHHSEGGSFDTARKVVEQVYGGKAPVSFQYDFIRIKGRGGKISSSSGEVIALPDVLEVYQPEIVRYLFAGTRPNTEFAISFDLDVLKIYEDYDKCERVYFGVQEISAKKADKEKRIYELSQVSSLPEVMPYQVPLRHLCNLLQVNEGDIEAVLDLYPDLKPLQRKRLEVRCRCAWNWITTFSPEDFRFSLRKAGDELPNFSDLEKKALSLLRNQVDTLADHDEKSLAEAIYAVAEAAGLDAKELFTLCYQVLIGKEKGPRLASFILTLGRDKVLAILDRVLS